MGLTLRSRTIEAIAPNGHRIIEEHGCPQNESEGHQASLLQSAHPNYSGMTAPVCQKVDAIAHGYREGEDRIVAYYRTLDWREWLFKNHNKGIVFRTPRQSHKEWKRDLEDVLLRGQDENTAADKTWSTDEGEAFGIRPKHSVIIRAVVDDEALIKNYDGKQNYVNSIIMGNVFADAEPGHLLLLGMMTNPVLDDTDLWEVEYHFLHHYKKWNSQCVSHQYETIFKKFQIYGYSDAYGGLFANGSESKWLTVPTGETYTARLFEEGDFSAINDMCS